MEKIDLFTTTMRLGATRELATVSNGSLARSRIINMQRSRNALVTIPLKFGVNVPYSKVKVFRNAIEKFINDRPREWKAMTGFRSTRIESDLGYIEYVIVAQHMKAWQKVVAVLQSRADLSSFCLEIQKKLGMKYEAPPLPVDLAMRTARHGDESVFATNETESTPVGLGENLDVLAKMFEPKKTR